MILALSLSAAAFSGGCVHHAKRLDTPLVPRPAGVVSDIAQDFPGADAKRFDEAYLAWRTAYLGCPEHTQGPTVCTFSAGHHDVHLFHMAREAAKSFFNLR
jgi:hypothetical protein